MRRNHKMNDAARLEVAAKTKRHNERVVASGLTFVPRSPNAFIIGKVGSVSGR